MKTKSFFAISLTLLFITTSLARAETLPLEEKQGADQASSVRPPIDKNTISLDAKGMDIVEVLKMLANRAGLNVVIGKNVIGKVTVFLKDVDVREAFEIILVSNDLACDERRGIIKVMTGKEYELIYGERYHDKKYAKTIQLKYAKAVEVAKSLNLIKSSIGSIVADEGSNTLFFRDSPGKVDELAEFIKNVDLPLKTMIFNLNYSQAEKIKDKIQEAMTKGVGSIKIDERTNKIAVTDYPETLKEITRIIKAFDEKTLQVLIDAQIIELRPSDKFELGVDWDYWIKKHFRVSSALPIGTSGRLLFGTPNETPQREGDYKAIVDLLRTIGDTKILSSPRIMALNNQEARIHVGTKDAYITSTTSLGGTGTTVTSQTVNFVDTGIKLFVTPTINNDGFVTMKIRPEVSSATRTNITSEGQVTQIPIVTTSEAETTIMIKDGVTVIIGGLKNNQRTKETKRIPVLGSIPLLGYLFGSTSDSVNSTDLVILLTPHIISGEVPFSDFAEIKSEDSRQAEMIKGDIVIEKKKENQAAGEAKNTVLEYHKLIKDKIIKVVEEFDNEEGEKGEVEIQFILGSDGRLENTPTIITSSNQNLDEAAIQCIKAASPFDSFPTDLGKKEESFLISLEYK